MKKNEKSVGCCCDGEIPSQGYGKVLRMAIAPPDFKLGDDESKLVWVNINEDLYDKDTGIKVEVESTKSMLKKGTHPNQKFYESMGFWDKNDTE